MWIKGNLGVLASVSSGGWGGGGGGMAPAKKNKANALKLMHTK